MQYLSRSVLSHIPPAKTHTKMSLAKHPRRRGGCRSKHKNHILHNVQIPGLSFIFTADCQSDEIRHQTISPVKFQWEFPNVHNPPFPAISSHFQNHKLFINIHKSIIIQKIPFSFLSLPSGAIPVNPSPFSLHFAGRIPVDPNRSISHFQTSSPSPSRPYPSIKIIYFIKQNGWNGQREDIP